MRVLIIDNYDSFTYNLYQYVGEILTLQHGCGRFEVTVERNDRISLSQIQELDPARIIISPGPGTPSDRRYFGVCADAITILGRTTPLLGVCLGMQGIAHCFGADIVRAATPMHGKTSLIRHDGEGIYRGLPQDIEIMRYHSLIVAPQTLPDCLAVTSVTAPDATGRSDDIMGMVSAGAEIMGVRHKEYPIEGIQFHPESFASEGGRNMLATFLG